MKAKVDVIIPAYNEEASIGKVILAIPKNYTREIIVCNNNSTDQTVSVAKKSGATVVTETKKGYGSACLKGIQYINQKPTLEQPDIVVFLDGDYSDYPEQMPLLLNEITKNDMDMVIGSRVLGKSEKGSMTIPQRFGNWLSTTLIRVLYKYTFTDLGPFRAIKWEALQALEMNDPDFGWTVEMQVKAAKMKMACTEVAVDYRQRIGKSKVSGTIRGTIMAGYKILWTIFKLK